MPETFTFELVSPEKLLFSKPAAMVTVPGGEGEYGVLPGHSPMVTTINPGVIQIYAEENVVTDRLFVAGGFAEVTQSRFTVLVGEAMPVSELNLVELQEQAHVLTGKIAAVEETERDAMQAQLDVLLAKIQAASSSTK